MSNNISRAGLMKFGAKCHMESFYEKGEIYLNTFSYFKELEEKDDGRADKDEYLLEFHSGEGLKKLSFEIGINGDMHKLSPENGLISVAMEYTQKEYTHLYCMSYIDLNWAQMHKKIIDEKNFADNKDYVVFIYNPNKFFEQVREAIKAQNWNSKSGFIEYVDKNNFSGDMGCFKKFNKFAYQNEFRIVFNCRNGKSDFNKPLKLYIGSIKDIAMPPMTKQEFYTLPFEIKRDKTVA